MLDDVDDDELRVGESLPGTLVRTLRRLGIDGPSALLDATEIKPCVANVSAWGEDAWTHRDALHNPEGGGWHVLRHRFDAALRARALALGVERIHARLGPTSWNQDLWRLESQGLVAPMLIDATGRSALVVRRQGVKRQRHSEQMAAVVWLRHPIGDRDDTTRIQSTRDGWWYSARLPQGLRVVAFHGLPAEVAQCVNEPEHFAACCNATALLPFELDCEAFVVGPKPVDASVHASEQVAGPGWFAIGDAALSFDPLSAQGVLFSLYSAIRAAEAVVQCLAQPELSEVCSAAYEHKIHSVLVANQRARQLLYASEQRYPDSVYWSTQREHHLRKR
jgi:flavin-dependent dehydrogenase